MVEHLVDAAMINVQIVLKVGQHTQDILAAIVANRHAMVVEGF
jgi:hypothetical protein